LKLPKAPVAARRAMYAALGLAVLISGGLAVVAVGLWRQGREPVPAANRGAVIPPRPPPPTFERPGWIMSDVPSTAYCHDMINLLMCVGVSSYRPTRDDAVAEASDAALEELVSAVGLRISDPFFRDAVVPGYGAVRAKALSALQATDLDHASAAYIAANNVVVKARKRVVEILHASGGAAVPTQRSDWYWEEYAAKKGGTETLVFVRYDVTLDAIKALVEKYSATTAIIGSTAMTAFPALAWQYTDFTGGAMFTKVARPLADAGIVTQSVVMAVDEQRVEDTTSLVRRIEAWKPTSGDLKLTVEAGEGPAHVVEIRSLRSK
jgi:hypothetical protein